MANESVTIRCPGRSSDPRPGHLGIKTPSPWIARFAALVPAGGAVLDVAAGGGRHARLFLERRHPVVCVDKDTAALDDLKDRPDAEILTLDLEGAAPPFAAPSPLAGRVFAGIVVSNYLFRPHFDGLIAALAPGGVLIFETFARGNESFGKPRNPDHLLRAGELLDLARGRLQVVAYEHGLDQSGPTPGVRQRLCAVNDLRTGARDDGEPAPHPLGG